MLSSMPRIPAVLTPGTLPLAELAAARLDGELFAVDEVWICADEPDGRELRAAALAALLPTSGATAHLVMMGLTAAWLHGAIDAPPWRHEVCMRLVERARLHLPRRFMLHERSLAGADECRVGPLRVTTPVRTAFDLARRGALADTERAAFDALVSAYGIRPDDLADGVRLPGGRLAMQRVAAARQRR
jgi:hypothetical protein